MKKLVKGMHKDSERVDQPENTYRDALNANLYYSKGAIVNEEGTSTMGAFPMQIIGTIPLLNNQVISFALVDDSGAATPSFSSSQSAIVLHDTKSKSTRILYKNSGLNFQKDFPIVGEFRVDAKNETIIYFTDNYHLDEVVDDGLQGGFQQIREHNPPRAFNVTRQLDHLKTSSEAQPHLSLYDENEEFDVEKLDLFARVGKHSIIEKANVYEGGVLVSGAYHLALCYSDENFLETDYFVVSNPVYIFQSKEQQYPVDAITGCQAGSQTNKAISFSVRVFKNNNYKFLQPAVIQRVGNAEFAFKLERIELDNDSDSEQIKINFTGNEDSSSTSVDDIIIDNVGYITAKAITQLDDRLYLANLQSRKDIGFQKYANNIKVKAITKEVNKFDIRVFDILSLNRGYAMMALPYHNRESFQGSKFGIGQTFHRKYSADGQAYQDQIRRTYFENIQELLNYGDSVQVGTNEGGIETGYVLTGKVAKGYKDFRFSFKQKGFRRNEVYALYISFVLNDGTESFAYHIPGRHALQIEDPTKPDTFFSEDQNFGQSTTTWESIFNVFGFYPEEIASNDPTAAVYQYVDTSDVDFVDGSTNDMSYWSNRNETYPSTRDFVGGAVAANGNATIDPALDLRGANVRHHKMPSNHNEDFSYVRLTSGNGYYSSEMAILTDTLNNTDVLNDTLTGFNQEYKGGDKKALSRDRIRILGVQLENIKIPRHILKRVQGYKIYYAKRKDEDKTILGQSVAVPAQPRYASTPKQNKLLARLGPFKNAFYLFGGLEHTDANAMEISAAWKGIAHETDKFIGHPVFTFHDFNMLRKRPTLEGVTHISCQNAMIFRSWQGGPGVFRKPAEISALFDGSGGGQLGPGGATKVTRFPSLGWIHPDLGNTTDFDRDGQIFDITDNFIDLTEDVENPYGYGEDAPATDEKKRKKGEQMEDTDHLQSKELMIKKWRTSVYIAAKYVGVSEVFPFYEIIKGGSNRNGINNHNKHWAGSEMTNKSLVLRVDPKSKIYARGQANIEIPESTSFKGASVLYNRGGESSIVLGLDSGLPHLKGFKLYSGNTDDFGWYAGPDGGTAFDLVKWGDHDQYLYPDACYNEKIPDYIDNNVTSTDDARFLFRGLNYSLTGLNAFKQGYPAAWLVNVESAKTDVYQPFDKQELVWTGYYRGIEPKQVKLADGTVDFVGLETGECLNDYGTVSNYYEGADSGVVFGGDTYISRYSFRTTSHSYGHCFFRAAINTGPDAGADSDGFHVANGNKDRFQADLPDYINPFDTSTWGKVGNMTVWDPTPEGEFETIDSTTEKIALGSQLINTTSNWQKGDVDPISTLFSFMVESDDNLGLRHKEDVDKGVSTRFFDADVAADVLFYPPTNDLTKQDNLLYEDHYSALQDIRVTVPFPKRKPADEDLTEFETRVIRSNAAGNIIGDKYRQFLAADFKDLPKNRGSIWTLFPQGGMLYIHTERALFRTQGKENLAVGDVTAFIGTGDIFAQDPLELSDSKNGYGGTTSVYGGINTPFGRYWISRRDRRVYNVTQQITEVVTGMESWFRDNIPFRIEDYGIDIDAEDFPYNADSTIAAAPMGFAVTYDPKYKRVLVTKREPVPTAEFTKLFDKGQIEVRNNSFVIVNDCTEYQDPTDFEESRVHLLRDENSIYNSSDTIYCGPIGLANQKYFKQTGWTLSYYPELQVWGSRHSYLPKLYVSTAEGMFSYRDNQMWAHDNLDQPGSFYGTTYPFEIDFIDNSLPGSSKTFSAVSYWVDVKKKDGENYTEFENKTNPGFTSFYVYNTTQVSALSTNLNYLNNVRKVDSFWYINSFRDLSKQTQQTSEYVNSGLPNVVDGFTTTVNAPISSESMFTSEGVVNPNYIDSTKLWHMQKRFVDNYMGVRLSNDNSSRNLLYLYAIGTKSRQSFR